MTAFRLLLHCHHKSRPIHPTPETEIYADLITSDISAECAKVQIPTRFSV
jgi:hypothetical protein